jgi:hypothetical protein
VKNKIVQILEKNMGEMLYGKNIWEKQEQSGCGKSLL